MAGQKQAGFTLKSKNPFALGVAFEQLGSLAEDMGGVLAEDYPKKHLTTGRVLEALMGLSKGLPIEEPSSTKPVHYLYDFPSKDSAHGFIAAATEILKTNNDIQREDLQIRLLKPAPKLLT